MAVATTSPGTAPTPRGAPTPPYTMGTGTTTNLPDPGNPDYQNPIQPSNPANPTVPAATPPVGTVSTSTPATNAGGQQFTDQSQQDAFSLLKSTFEGYGLGSLVPTIIDFIRQGYSGDTVALMLKETPAYKARFPAMDALNQSGRAITEVDYINYERNAVQLEQQYGVPKGMASDPGNIAKLLVNNVSAQDLTQRFQLNAAASLDAPPELQKALKDYYGLDQGSITAYYLEPDHSLDYLTQQMATAKIGAAAGRQSINLGLSDAQTLAQRGITDSQAQQGFQQVASLTGLTGGNGETATQGDLVQGVFGDAAAAQKVDRVQRGRAAAFQAGGGANESAQGVSGLGSR